MKLLKHNPWKVLSNRSSEITVTLKVSLVAIILTATLTAGFYMAYLLPVPAEIYPLTLLASLIIAGIAVSALSLRARTYSLQTTKNRDLEPGQILIKGKPSWFSSGAIIGSVFDHQGDEEIQVGLMDGSAFVVPHAGESKIAIPDDLFSILRPIQTSYKFSTTDPTDSEMAIMLSIWDQKIDQSVIKPSQESVINYLENYYLDTGETVNLNAFGSAKSKAIATKLILSEHRGLLGDQKEYLNLSEFGQVATASYIRSTGIEPFARSKKKEPIMVGKNYGNIFNNSPAAAGVVGSGTAAGGSIATITQSLHVLIDKRTDVLNKISDPNSRERVAEALSEIEHEIEHPRPDGNKLKKYFNIVLRFAGSVAASVVGAEVWNILLNWTHK
jgi:hypothetical protein